MVGAAAKAHVEQSVIEWAGQVLASASNKPLRQILTEQRPLQVRRAPTL